MEYCPKWICMCEREYVSVCCTSDTKCALRPSFDKVILANAHIHTTLKSYYRKKWKLVRFSSARKEIRTQRKIDCGWQNEIVLDVYLDSVNCIVTPLGTALHHIAQSHYNQCKYFSNDLKMHLKYCGGVCASMPWCISVEIAIKHNSIRR